MEDLLDILAVTLVTCPLAGEGVIPTTCLVVVFALAATAAELCCVDHLVCDCGAALVCWVKLVEEATVDS